MEEWWRGEPSLAIAGSGLRIAAVKRALFYLFIVVLLKRWWRSGCASALQLCYCVWARSMHETHHICSQCCRYNLSFPRVHFFYTAHFCHCYCRHSRVTMVTSSLRLVLWHQHYRMTKSLYYFYQKGKRDKCRSVKVRPVIAVSSLWSSIESSELSIMHAT